MNDQKVVSIKIEATMGEIKGIEKSISKLKAEFQKQSAILQPQSPILKTLNSKLNSQAQELNNKQKKLVDLKKIQDSVEISQIKNQSKLAGTKAYKESKLHLDETLATQKRINAESLKSQLINKRLTNVRQQMSEMDIKGLDKAGQEEALTRQLSLLREQGRLLQNNRFLDISRIQDTKQQILQHPDYKSYEKTGKASKSLNELLVKEQTLMSDNSGRIKAYNQNLQDTAKVKKQLQNLNPPFQGWAMSIMFAGMALQRLAIQLKQFGTKAYDDISHSVEGTVTANDRLNASMTMLGFSVGEALAPLLDSLLPIIDGIEEWVQKNPELISDLTMLFAVLGTAAAAGGSLVLAGAGFQGLIDVMRKIPLSTKALKDFDWDSIGSAIQTGIGVVAIGVGIKNTIEGVDEFLNGTGEDSLRGALKALGGILTSVGGLMLVQKAKGGVWMIMVGLAMDSASTGTLFADINKITGVMKSTFETTFNAIIHGFKRMTTILAGGVDIGKFDYGKEWRKNYQAFIEEGREIDKWISSLVKPDYDKNINEGAMSKLTDAPAYYPSIKQQTQPVSQSTGLIFNNYGNVTVKSDTPKTFADSFKKVGITG